MNKGLFLCGLFIALFLAACGDDEVKIANQMTLYSRPDTIHLGGDLGMDSILVKGFTACEAYDAKWGGLDGVVHSIGFAPREAIQGDFLEGLSRDAFKTALDISAYSFPALIKALVPLMEGHPSSVLTLTYLGSERVVPNYNTMGVAKAALEASVRYLANSLGPKGIRANAISSGPIKTLAASGIKDFSKILKYMETAAPLRRTVTIDEVGNTAAFLLSDYASGITGDNVYVDAGFHAVAVPDILE